MQLVMVVNLLLANSVHQEGTCKCWRREAASTCSSDFATVVQASAASAHFKKRPRRRMSPRVHESLYFSDACQLFPIPPCHLF